MKKTLVCIYSIALLCAGASVQASGGAGAVAVAPAVVLDENTLKIEGMPIIIVDSGRPVPRFSIDGLYFTDAQMENLRGLGANTLPADHTARRHRGKVGTVLFSNGQGGSLMFGVRRPCGTLILATHNINNDQTKYINPSVQIRRWGREGELRAGMGRAAVPGGWVDHLLSFLVRR